MVTQINNYWMVQGYRLIDVNILRVAMEAALACGHSDIMLTECNPHETKVI